MTVDEAAEKLEAIARARQVQEVIGDLAGRMDAESRLKKASGMESLKGIEAEEVAEHPNPVMSGAVVLGTLARMCRDQKEGNQ